MSFTFINLVFYCNSTDVTDYLLPYDVTDPPYWGRCDAAFPLFYRRTKITFFWLLLLFLAQKINLDFILQYKKSLKLFLQPEVTALSFDTANHKD